MYLIDFIHDYETKSRRELSKTGAVNYATDPSTDITLLTYCFGRTGVIKVWKPGMPVPAELIHVFENPHMYRFIAWNLLFDYLISTMVLKRYIPGMKAIPVENLDDCMAKSCHFRTGASLEACSKMLNLPYNKDPIGRKLMLKSCKPNAKGEFIELTEEEYKHFENYGIMDTRILRDCYYTIPDLPSPERYAFEWTIRRNLRGIKLDVPLIYEMASIIEENLPKLAAEFTHITGTTMGSPVRCLEFFKPHYPGIQNMQADTVRDMLVAEHEVPAHVRRALEIKDLAGSTSIVKVRTAILMMYSGKIFEVLAYHYAQTKRWSGRGLQIQNLPRVDNKKQDDVNFDMNVKDLAAVVRAKRPHLKDPVGFVKNLIRRIFIPAEGKQFYCGDWAKIEPTVLFWFVGLGPIPPKWYEEMASEIYNIPVHLIGKDSEERQVGKTADLSCGYGAGHKSFRLKTYKDTGIMLSKEMAKTVVFAYRNKYKPVVEFWSALEDGFRKAVRGEASALCNGKLHIMPMGKPWKGVQIRLPSGGYLFYHQAEEYTKQVFRSYKPDADGETVEISEAKWRELPYDRQQLYYSSYKKVLRYMSDQGQGRIAWDEVYGGLLCENVTSATAREIMVPSVWRLEQAGFDVLGCIHDELWADHEAGKEEEFKRLMCINPSWCPDMNIGAELKTGERYLK